MTGDVNVVSHTNLLEKYPCVKIIIIPSCFIFLEKTDLTGYKTKKNFSNLPGIRPPIRP